MTKRKPAQQLTTTGAAAALTKTPQQNHATNLLARFKEWTIFVQEKRGGQTDAVYEMRYGANEMAEVFNSAEREQLAQGKVVVRNLRGGVECRYACATVLAAQALKIISKE